MSEATTPSEPSRVAAPQGLLRVLGLVFGLSVVVGGVIGSGIMRAPGLVALGVPTAPGILLAWVAGGIVTMIAAMPLVEAGASVPRAGGAYPIAQRAFGPLAGFLTGWVTWLQYTAANAFISVVFGEYVHRLGLATTVPVGALACGLILAMAAMNWVGTKASGASQSLASGLKGASFLVLVALLYVLPHGHVALHHAPLAAAGVAASVMAVRVIYSTYAGWDGAIYFSEEVQRPDRNIARATFIGIAAVTVIYVLVNAAVLHALPPSAIAGSDLAVGDAARATMGKAGDAVVTAIGLLSLAAIVNLQIMAGSRITFRMAADGILPRALAKVAPRGAPRRSVALVVLASLIFAATGSYESIVRIYAPWSIGGILIICLCAVRLRIAEPALERPWKMPLFPLPAIIAIAIQVGLIGLMVWDDPVAGLLSAVVVLAPAPIWLVLQWRRRRRSLR
jgi:APA family basic amino acid/polyamine antiporter